MVILEKTSSGVTGIFKKIASAALVVSGFVLIFFTTHSKSSGVTQSIYGADVAHADVPSGDSASSSGDASGSGSGASDCGGGGDCGGSDGCGGCGDSGSDSGGY